MGKLRPGELSDRPKETAYVGALVLKPLLSSLHCDCFSHVSGWALGRRAILPWLGESLPSLNDRSLQRNIPLHYRDFEENWHSFLSFEAHWPLLAL